MCLYELKSFYYFLRYLSTQSRPRKTWKITFLFPKLLNPNFTGRLGRTKNPCHGLLGLKFLFGKFSTVNELKSIVKKPRIQNIEWSKFQSQWNCNPEEKCLFLASSIGKSQHPSCRKPYRCPKGGWGSGSGPIDVLGWKSNFPYVGLDGGLRITVKSELDLGGWK